MGEEERRRKEGAARLVRQTNDGVSSQRSNASLVGTQGDGMRAWVFFNKLRRFNVPVHG